jgi:hypothetical protein
LAFSSLLLALPIFFFSVSLNKKESWSLLKSYEAHFFAEVVVRECRC